MMLFQPPGEDEPFAIFTDTELLIGFQKTEHAIIYMYYLNDLARHMVKTIPNVVPTSIPISPNTTYRVDFQGEGVQLYRKSLLQWRPHFQEVANGQLRFFGRTKSTSIPPLIMVSTLAWPPTHVPKTGDRNVVLAKARATFFSQVNINRSRFLEELWTLGTAKKTIGILAIDVVRDPVTRFMEYQHAIKLFDISGDPHGETTMGGEGKETPMGELLWTSYPQWLEKHGSPVSLDMDDTHGRMVISMSDGTLAVIEFV